MPSVRQLTAIILRDGDIYVAHCPELDVTSRGETVDEARKQLSEAVEGFFAWADKDLIERRLAREVIVTSLDIAIG